MSLSAPLADGDDLPLPWAGRLPEMMPLVSLFWLAMRCCSRWSAAAFQELDQLLRLVLCVKCCSRFCACVLVSLFETHQLVLAHRLIGGRSAVDARHIPESERCAHQGDENGGRGSYTEPPYRQGVSFPCRVYGPAGRNPSLSCVVIAAFGFVTCFQVVTVLRVPRRSFRLPRLAMLNLGR